MVDKNMNITNLQLVCQWTLILHTQRIQPKSLTMQRIRGYSFGYGIMGMVRF